MIKKKKITRILGQRQRTVSLVAERVTWASCLQLCRHPKSHNCGVSLANAIYAVDLHSSGGILSLWNSQCHSDTTTNSVNLCPSGRHCYILKIKWHHNNPIGESKSVLHHGDRHYLCLPRWNSVLWEELVFSVFSMALVSILWEIIFLTIILRDTSEVSFM